MASSGKPRGSAPRVVWAVTVGHFAIDVFNSMGPVLLAFLQTPLQLSATQVGLGVGLHQFLAGATQPAFGWLVDRVGSRVIGPLSVAWAIVFVCLALVSATTVSSWPLFLLLFALAAIGSGAFHPQGVMHAGTPISGRAATTTAVFFLFGQLGLASGPPLAGLALDLRGPTGIFWLAAVLLPVSVLMIVLMSPRASNPAPPARAQRVVTEQAPSKRDKGAVPLLAIIFAARAWLFIGTAVFLPLLFKQQGWSSSRQGVVAGLFWLGGGLTGVVAGMLADRYGRRLVVCVTTLLGSILLPIFVMQTGGLAFPLAFVCGGLLGAPHSVLMVMAQALLPMRPGLASGVALGYLFAMGALSSWAIGALADRLGLVPVLQWGAAAGLLVVLLCLLLPSSHRAAR